MSLLWPPSLLLTYFFLWNVFTGLTQSYVANAYPSNVENTLTGRETNDSASACLACDISCSQVSIDSTQTRDHDTTATSSLSSIVRTDCVATKALRNAPDGSACRTESANRDDNSRIGEGLSHAHMDNHERVLGLQKRSVSTLHSLFKRAGGNFREGLAHSGSKGKAACKMTNYCFKPYYPGPSEVKKYETKPKAEQAELAPFIDQAKYWAIIERHPDGTLIFPSWQLTATTQQAHDPDGEEPGFAIGGSDKYFVTIDHVYEIRVLDTFFADMIKERQLTCENIAAVFDQPGAEGMGTKLGELFSNLATYQNPDLWEWTTESIKQKHSFGIPSGETATMLQYDSNQELINEDSVRTFFVRTNARIYQAFAAIGPEWASAYRTWMINKITVQNTGLQAAAQRVISAIPTAAGDPRAAGQEQRLPQWSAYMSSLLATYPVASMTIPAVQHWPVLATETTAVPTGLKCDPDVPTVTPGRVARAVAVDDPGAKRQSAAMPSITSIPANS